MTVSELKHILDGLDDDLELVIEDGDIFWPICYEYSGMVGYETDGIPFEYYMLSPCKGHEDDPPIEVDYIPDEGEITLN